MKRLPIAAAAVLAGAIQLQWESEGPECKQLPCAVEPVSTVPEQPHSLEEPPNYEVPEGMVEIGSPMYLVERSSEAHLEYLRRNGLKFEDAIR